MKSIEQTYQKKSQREHVLLRPGMYIGDIDRVTHERWVYTGDKMIRKEVIYSPGLYKIFDEIFTNATDHSQRDLTMKKIDVSIDKATGRITVMNDGEGIPIEIHKEYNKYVPEIIFGEFHTSSNYDDTEKRTVGGLNGYGAKLTCVFSTEFTVELCDSKKHYIQTWTDNMSNVTKPSVKSTTKKSFTKISFIPDYARFGITIEEMYELFKTRVYDGAAITDKRVSITFDSERLSTKDFENYVNLFIGSKTEATRVYERINDRWEVCFALNPYDKFTQVSFVNGISTTDGGTHVDYVVNQVIYKIKDQLEKKHKDITIRPSYIKDNILVFVNCLIENPVFSSQTKENHVTKITKFGSKCELTEDIFKKIEKLGIANNVIEIAKAKDNKSLAKTDGKKQIRLTGIPKLDDANKAGTAEGWKCKLILTEGDSAKTTAEAGLGIVGRDYYGVFPLKGKVLNVRDATPSQILKNEEINNLKKILGLQQSKVYTSAKELRYGGIVIFTDADNDGSHIKGLLINFIHAFWPSLLKIDSFITTIITPIVKVSKGKQILEFYDQNEYITWKNETNVNGWNIKYYKGLGTSTAIEAKEYFKNIQKLTVKYNYDLHTDENILKAFKKGYEDDRKEWIKKSTGKELGISHKQLSVDISLFINNQLVNFSIADLVRSVPNMIDGFKPSQRKVLFGCIKRRLYQDIKVAQLAGYISEHSAYHHGEASLHGTIIGMAHDFVGSNNINLLEPVGQFGTRLQGGKDASSPRYIFTKLNSQVEVLFNENDNKLLKYLDDDGFSIEPEYYIPIIPMILVNGSEGIGTGYSTSIPCYNPKDIINNLQKLIDNPESDLDEMKPWYKGFKGTIEKVEGNKFITRGVWKRQNTTMVEVTELPVGKWTQVYKEFLESLVESNEIIDYKNNSDDQKVHFTVIMQKTVIDNLIDTNQMESKLKLTSTLNISNMHVFDENCKIIKVSCPEEIIFKFYKVRKTHYTTRKKYLIDTLAKESEILDSKVKFIKYVISEKIVVFNKKKDFIIEQIQKVGDLVQVNSSWDYLLELKLWTFTEERIKNLVDQSEKTKKELDVLKRKTIQEIWNSELNSLLN